MLGLSHELLCFEQRFFNHAFELSAQCCYLVCYLIGDLAFNLSRESADESSLTIDDLSHSTKLLSACVTARTTGKLLGFFYKGLL